MSHLRTLPTLSAARVSGFVCPDHAGNDLASPATEVFTDFSNVQPLVIESDVSITDAESIMKKTHVKLKLVVNSDDGFLGIVAFRDLQGSRFQTLIGLGTAPDAIKVKDVMIPKAELRGVCIDALRHATIGDLVQTLQSVHCQHTLVLNAAATQICGLVSASDIARHLRVPIDISSTPSFADICHVVYSHTQQRELRHA